MIFDAAAPNLIPEPHGASSSCPPTVEQMFTTYASPLEEVQVPGVDEIVNNETYLKFQEVLSAADEPLWTGCDKHTKLSFTARLLNIKAESNLSEDNFNKVVQAIEEALPQDNILPNDFYSMKKLTKELGLPVERIDVCRDGCMLYWGDDADANVCRFCNQDRKDMRLICKRPTLDVDESSRGPKPKAIYTLNKEQRRVVCEWLKSLRFPDGYVSNLGRCIDMKEFKLIGLKSHDCHIFMERLIPIAFKELLPNFVWGTITELSIFLHDISSTVLRYSQMEKLERDIPIILCNLERIFPPSFFDSMEHLLVHLPYEAKVGGPVHFRWMYPFERFLYHLKKKVKNKAHVEASIVNAYIVEEVTTFASYYFEPHIQTKRRRPGRNDEGPIDPNTNIFSIFNYLGRPSGQCKQRYLTDQEWRAAQTYVLLNCPEVSPYFEIFQNLYSDMPTLEFDRFCDQEFAPWFKSYVYDNQAHLEHQMLFHLSWGPKAMVRTWPAYFINGYNFHTQEYGKGKTTMNSGVIRGETLSLQILAL
ncbi:uncharacterized protein LOC121972368 [Zingiber officinale]|uniref:uncharacterized protein LOC121972368 n=1 Tax=Zingiber officinale TaxID=94328 RepID=UPI001C4B8BDF|nr:uncharacterized protein LOC121972368 [Zingiber officinale]